MKNKYIIILTFLIAGLFLFFYFKPFSSSEIIVLDHLTEYENGSIDQICLVKHTPASSTKLKELIEEFNKNNLAEDRKFRRLFIKEHDNIFLPGLFLSENIDYYLKTIKRDDLDNIDFLGRSYSSETIDGKPHKSTVVYVGKIYYYKEQHRPYNFFPKDLPSIKGNRKHTLPLRYVIFPQLISDSLEELG